MSDVAEVTEADVETATHFFYETRMSMHDRVRLALKSDRERLKGAAAPVPCRTCGGSGWLGGPTYAQPDEGGEPCPDCDAPAKPVRLRPVTEADANALHRAYFAGGGYSTGQNAMLAALRGLFPHGIPTTGSEGEKS